MLLLTGATGFIGRHLLDRLEARQAPVRCLVRRRNPDLPPWVELAQGDLLTGRGVEDALRGVDAVIHLAGVTKALSDADYFEGNVRATEALAKALRGREARVAHVSSLAAMGPGENVAEDDNPRPISLYGRSKLEGEQAMRALLPAATIIRPPVVYGPRDTDVFQAIKAVAQGFTLEIAGGDRRFSAIYVKDLAEGLLQAVSDPRASGRAYFLAYPKAYTRRELSATAAAVMGRKPPRVLKVPYAAAWGVGAAAELWSKSTRKPGILSRDKVREARYMAWVCRADRAPAELGFTARTDLEAGLRETLAWYKQAGWLRY